MNKDINWISITNLYRKLLLDYLKRYTMCTEYEAMIDNFIFTEKYDKDFMKKNDIIKNERDLYNYKKVILRLILSDNYTYIKTQECDNQENEHINDIYNLTHENNKFINEEESFYNERNSEIIEYILDCINKNLSSLPIEFKLREMFYENFIDYNMYEFDKTYDYQLLEKYGHTKTLKKINPYYLLDCLKQEK